MHKVFEKYINDESANIKAIVMSEVTPLIGTVSKTCSLF